MWSAPSNVAPLEQSIGEGDLQILQLRRSFDEEIAAKLQEAQRSLVEAQERMTSAEDQVRRLEIRAPVSGTVVGLVVHTVGAVVTPGQLLRQTVPGEDWLLVEVEIRVEDVERFNPTWIWRLPALQLLDFVRPGGGKRKRRALLSSFEDPGSLHEKF